LISMKRKGNEMKKTIEEQEKIEQIQKDNKKRKQSKKDARKSVNKKSKKNKSVSMKRIYNVKDIPENCKHLVKENDIYMLYLEMVPVVRIVLQHSCLVMKCLDQNLEKE
jgi:ectoine hydroxylase-related dioxygenase (phytanoyl-CoA dioxygenase family)